jgi:hypothetical protein
VRERLQILHGRQYGNLHHLLQLKRRKIAASAGTFTQVYA